MDDEQMADFYDKKYGGRNRVQSFKGSAEDVPQQLLLPSVNDPNLWMIKCKVCFTRELLVYELIKCWYVFVAGQRKRRYLQFDEAFLWSTVQWITSGDLFCFCTRVSQRIYLCRVSKASSCSAGMCFRSHFAIVTIWILILVTGTSQFTKYLLLHTDVGTHQRNDWLH